MPHRHVGEAIRRTPVTLPETATVQEACREMHEHRIGAILVLDEHGHLSGIFTGRDAVRLLADGHNHAHNKLARVMTRNPECLGPKHHAIEALRIMHDGGFRHLPIVEGGKLLGIVSVGDFRSHQHARLDEETGFWERI